MKVDDLCYFSFQHLQVVIFALQFLAILVFLISFLMIEELISTFCEQFDWTWIIFLYFCYYFIFIVVDQAKSLDHIEGLSRISFSSFLLNSYHNVNFCLVRFYPLWKEQIDITYHFIILVENNKGVLPMIEELPTFLKKCSFSNQSIYRRSKISL